MRLLTLLIIILSFALNCVAIDVILNPYENLDYEQINSYNFREEKRECECYDYY